MDSVDNVYFLGDNPSFSVTWSCYSKKLPTFRRNSGWYYQRATGRVMTPSCKLSALAWPTTNEMAKSMLTSTLPSLDVKRSELMQGNAMNLMNVAIVVLLGLACFSRNPDEPADGLFSDDPFDTLA